MANFDKIGEYGLDLVLAKRLTTPGGAVAPTVAPELFPGITLENDRPEWSFLKGEVLCAKYDGVTAVVGAYSMMQLYLPTNARTIAVITKIKNFTANPVSIARLVGIGGGLGGWSGRTTSHRDTRFRGEGTACILERTTNVALPSAFPIVTALLTTYEETTTPLVLAPGGAYGVFSQNLNVSLTLGFEWYERQAQPGELV